MKVALMIDKCSQDSFYIERKKAFNFKDNKRFSHQHCITKESVSMTQGLFSIPFVFGDDGVFIKMSEFPGGLPKLDLDVIILNTEKSWNFDYSTIRKAYPNAFIVATLKEHNPSNGVYNQNTIDLYRNCDAATVQYADLSLFQPFMNLVGLKKLYRLQQPYPVEWLYRHYGVKDNKEKHNRIMLYKPSADPNQAIKRGYDLSSNLARKLNLIFGVEILQPEPGQSWEDFLKMTASCGWCINLDPMYMVGQQPIQCAIVKNYNLGGETDAHRILWQKSSTLNEVSLLKIFEQLKDNLSEKMKELNAIHQKAIDLYSFQSYRETLEKIIKEN